MVATVSLGMVDPIILEAWRVTLPWSVSTLWSIHRLPAGFALGLVVSPCIIINCVICLDDADGHHGADPPHAPTLCQGGQVSQNGT